MSTATRGKKPIITEEKLPPSFRRAKPVVLPQKGYNDYSESELVDQFTPMVIKWVHRLAYHHSLKQEMDDLRNIGLTALIKAKRNFKPELKVPFVAYCSTRIRGAILDATIDCLIEVGYQKATIARIAKTAGVTTGAVQHHFESRQALMRAAISEQLFAPHPVDWAAHASKPLRRRCKL